MRRLLAFIFHKSVFQYLLLRCSRPFVQLTECTENQIKAKKKNLFNSSSQQPFGWTLSSSLCCSTRTLPAIQSAASWSVSCRRTAGRNGARAKTWRPSGLPSMRWAAVQRTLLVKLNLGNNLKSSYSLFHCRNLTSCNLQPYPLTFSSYLSLLYFIW